MAAMVKLSSGRRVRVFCMACPQMTVSRLAQSSLPIGRVASPGGTSMRAFIPTRERNMPEPCWVSGRAHSSNGLVSERVTSALVKWVRSRSGRMGSDRRPVCGPAKGCGPPVRLRPGGRGSNLSRGMNSGRILYGSILEATVTS